MARVFQECMVLVLLPDENRRCQQSSGQIPWFKHQPFLFTTQRKKIEATKTYGCPGTIAVPLFLAYQAPLDPIFSPNWHVTWYDENHWLFWQVAPGNFFLGEQSKLSSIWRLVINSVFQLWNSTCSRRTFQISTPLGRCWWFHVPRKRVDWINDV